MTLAPASWAMRIMRPSTWSGTPEIIVRGGGVPGFDTLTVEGTDEADSFLFRALAAVAGHPDASRPAFVAAVNATAGTAERIVYDRGTARLTVTGHDGDDTFAFDDNSTATTVHGGAGDDTFIVGQFHPAPAIEPAVQPGDAFATDETEFGWLSRGASFALVLYGHEGDDAFQVSRHRAELRVEGTVGDDLYDVRAVRDAEGEYLQNGLLWLEGTANTAGAPGVETLLIRTAGAAGDIDVRYLAQEVLIRGAGLHIMTRLMDGAAVLAAPFTASEPIVLPADLLPSPWGSLTVPIPDEHIGLPGLVIITESAGSTRLITGVKEIDSYTIRLTTPATERVHIAISGAYAGGRHYAEVSVDGGVTFADHGVLVIEPGELGPFEIFVRLVTTTAPHGIGLFAFVPTAEPGPGMIVQTMSHVVSSADPRFDRAHAANVYINLPPPLVPSGEDPGDPTDPTDPGDPGDPGDGGGSGVPGGGRPGAAGEDLPATGGALDLRALGIGLLTLLLGLILIRARRRAA